MKRDADDAAALPVRLMAAQLAAALARTGRLIVTAETGSGKTTQLPQILAQHGTKGTILVLEPRRLAARLVARRVAAEMGTDLGDTVGFRTRFDSAWSANTRIGFVTEGVFLRMLLGDPQLRGVGAVIVDEFHERSLQADMAISAVASLQKTRGDLAFVVMSATLDAQSLAASLTAEHVHASGRNFPITIEHRREPLWKDMPAAAAKEAVELAQRLQGDVLVFMPGAAEIDATLRELQPLARALEIEVRRLHGSMPPQEQDAALDPSKRRRIVVCTNVAQTSITVPGICGVVDAGYARIHRFDAKRGIDVLRPERISRAAADQRAGRAGRTRAGCCVRLWSEADHDRREAFDLPEIQRSELSEAVMLAAALAGKHGDFRWIEAPAAESLKRAVDSLQALGAIDAAGALTARGRSMSRIPAPPRVASLLTEAAQRGCLRRASRWAAIITERDIVRSATATALLHALHDGDPPSDILVRERVLEAWQARKLPRSIEVSEEALREVLRAAERLEQATRSALDLEREVDLGASLENLTLSLLAGYADHIVWKPDARRPHVLASGRRKALVDRDSVVSHAGFLLALEARENPADPAAQLLSMIAPIEKEWLEKVMPQRFATKKVIRWNDTLKAVEEAEEEDFDDIVLSSTSRPPKDLAQAAAILVTKIREGVVSLPLWDDEVTQWIERVRCVSLWHPERNLLAYDERDVECIQLEIVSGAVRANELQSRPCLAAVKEALSYEDQRFVEKMAPAALKLPSGRSMPLKYEAGSPPRGAAKIQWLYGLDATPAVGGGRAPIVLEILGPNMRPLQVTGDLAGFWRTLYPQLRNNLKRRYPKHEWR
ncbi:MAG: ATP-dependent helicase HrpB [Planctomycetes bacterium]|nr:ATP-dependent helicase HrpB [Planctomycetota bacterium]